MTERVILPKPPRGAQGTELDDDPEASHKGFRAACEACRWRKTKCDGGRPACQSCTIRKKDCHYTALPGLTRIATLKQEVSRVQTENSSMLEILWYLQTKSAGEAIEFLNFIRANAVGDVLAVREWVRSQGGMDTEQDMMSAEEQADVTEENWAYAMQQRALSETDAATKSRSDSLTLTPGTTDQFDQDFLLMQEPIQNATVADVQMAVNAFFSNVGILFYVFRLGEVEVVLKEAFGEIVQPELTSFQSVLKGVSGVSKRARIAEICGMAAVGWLYLRLDKQRYHFPSNYADNFYFLSRHMLDSAIEANPLRATKVCTLLAMYNIVLKASVGLAYIELGLGLGRKYGLSSKECPPTMTKEEFIDHQQTWRTLHLFAGWIGSSLGYLPAQDTSNFQLGQQGDSIGKEELLQREIVKVTAIKTKILRATTDDSLVGAPAIEALRVELGSLYNHLPSWMTLSGLGQNEEESLRRIILYFHLFLLSAMELLHRRVLSKPKFFGPLSTEESQTVNHALRDGLIAARILSRILKLMREDGKIVQICWLCMFAAYTSGTILLYAVVQKLLNGYLPDTWIGDLSLASICVKVLDFCGQVDGVAGRFKDTISVYFDAIQEATYGEMNLDLPTENDERDAAEYLLNVKPGDSELHKASRDLLSLIRRPFGGGDLELIPHGGPPCPELRSNLVSWVEATAGTTVEWAWELRNCDGSSDLDKQPHVSSNSQSLSTGVKLSPGEFIDCGSDPAWKTWTPNSASISHGY